MATNFKVWLCTLIQEKGKSLDDTVLDTNGKAFEDQIGFTHAHLVEDLSGFTEKHAEMKYMLVLVDFKNGDVFHYLGHLAEGIVKIRNKQMGF